MVKEKKQRFIRFRPLEITIIVFFIVVIGYRLALVYDLVPDSFQPGTVIDEIYVDVKKDLLTLITQDTTTGRIAKWTLNRMIAWEKYFHMKSVRYARAKKAAERCQENMLFRYFMFMGEEDNTQCSQRNMVLQEQTKEIFNSTKPVEKQRGQNKGGAQRMQQQTAPSVPAPEPTPTPVQKSEPVTVAPVAPVPAPVPTPVPAAPVATTPTPAPVAPATVTPPPTYVPPAAPAGPPGRPVGRQPVSVSHPE